MSLAAMSWAFGRKGLRPIEKVVLLVLADFANEDGECYPGQVLIAERADVSDRTVRNVLLVLEDKGFLRREERRRNDGYRTSDFYTLAISPERFSGRSDLTGTDGAPHRNVASGQEPSVEPSGISTPTPSSIDTAYDALYRAWPKKEGEEPGRRAWRRLSAADREAAMAPLVAHANAHRNNTPPQFIPRLSTVIRDRRWGEALAVPRGIGGRQVEPERPKQFVVPQGHRVIRDDMTGQILGTEPVDG